MKKPLVRLGLALAVIGFTGAVFVFIAVQVLQSYPFHQGVFGNQQFLPGVTYTVALEVFAVVAWAGIFTRIYDMTRGPRRDRAVRAVATTLMVTGLVVAPVVYTETHILWGEVLPGVRVWGGLQGGGGYPWGAEQVAYNTCFVQSAVAGDCNFLNYDELLLISCLGILAGYVLRQVKQPLESIDPEFD